MKLKRTIIKVDVEIYNRSIIFIIGYSKKEAFNYFCEYYKNSPEDLSLIQSFGETEESYVGGSTFMLPNSCDICIWIPKTLYTIGDYRILVHEISHATIMILDHLNIAINDENSEAFCYLHDYIYSEIVGKYSDLT